ncbi:hypothetical protein GIB67_018257 [Kingdonia uniflora]|uniref:Uncharacterized protein n=1 Tax=Kingdonia uniflora TaxID=39325 RepID=A0A7J7LEW3_9MAGN|nr:hypothetical protein GIB67_018257 [Kingdonia uniflora]
MRFFGINRDNEVDFAAFHMVVKPIPLDFDAMSTPRKERPSSSSTRNRGRMQNRETTQKVALRALRDASATENLVRVLKYERLPRNLF